MRRKLVLWGTNEKEEKILVALELIEAENKVDIYTFDQSVTTEEFYNDMLNKWREDQEVAFPSHEKIERPLSVTEAILPETIKVERTDLVTRAQSEWHFVVLSAKLYQMYKSEVEDISETVGNLTKFDSAVWDELKGFWSKVQEQVYGKSLFREHAASLKEKTNSLFDQLKELKKSFEKEYEAKSSEQVDKVMSQLKEIEEKVEKGMGLKPLFEELKQMQRQIKEVEFTRKHRRQVWDKIDAAFKVVKEKRFGDKPGQAASTPKERLERRYNGLLDAIAKMEKSIKRDRDDQEWQSKRANNTDGQLEMQIRQAKIKMIDERIKSKDVKLQDMLKTKIELEDRIQKEIVREEKRKQKEAEEKAKAEAAEVAKAKIAEEIKVKNEENAEMSDKLSDAASKIVQAKATTEVPPVELPKEDAPATEKTEEEKISEAIDDAAEKISEVKDQATDFISGIAATIGEAFEDVVDTVKAVAEVVEDKIEEAIENSKSEEE